MEAEKQPLIKYVDCIELYIPELHEGIEYYCKSLGLNILWKSASMVGLGTEGKTEIVLQNERREMNIDFKVDCVIAAAEKIKKAGGHIIDGPFDVPIGKCAVVKDPWDNKYVILDTTKGTYLTDSDGNIIGLKAPE